KLIQDLVAMHATEGNLRRGDQAEVRVLEAVDLSFRPARNETDSFEHFAPGHVRRDDRRIALADQDAHGVLHERQLQQDRLIFEEVEFLPRNACSRLEVDELEGLTHGDVVLYGELELARVAPTA